MKKKYDMLTNRCSNKLSRELKEHKFPQYSLIFDNAYYDTFGTLRLGDVPSEDCVFAPFICEVLDWLCYSYDLYVSISHGKYEIYNESSGSGIEKLTTTDSPVEIYEEAIKTALEWIKKS